MVAGQAETCSTAAASLLSQARLWVQPWTHYQAQKAVPPSSHAAYMRMHIWARKTLLNSCLNGTGDSHLGSEKVSKPCA